MAMDSARCSGPDKKIPLAPGTNQMQDLLTPWFRTLTSCKEDKS